MNIREYEEKKILKFLGLVHYDATPGDDRETFINDSNLAAKQKLREYNVWYSGDGDELLNFYTRQNTIDYNYEPWYSRNKRSYFWAVSSTEEDIKRTHSGQPRNIVDTLVNVINKPSIEGGPDLEGHNDNVINSNIDKIIRTNNFWNMYKQVQMPMTLVEGWGCYKINWDKDLSDYPLVVYYRAENVDFVYRNNILIAAIFKDYYTNKKNRKYLMVEIRRIEPSKKHPGQRDLHIEKEAFEVTGEDDNLKKIDLESVPEFRGADEHIIVENFNKLLAVPCVFYSDNAPDTYGRSIYTGKIDLFDDLDQCLSQAANAVRKSTPVEYFNTDFLERDRKTGMPIQPKAFDRKYTMYAGGRDASGAQNTNEPIQVTQPQIMFDQYTRQSIDILMHIVEGVMSPATLGIDLSKRDNAEAQREKEKVTIFTRNSIIDAETDILKSLFSQLLCAYEMMTSGRITVKDYDVSVNFSEFADDSYENKIEKLGNAYAAGIISEKMLLSKLYGHSLSKEDYQAELEYLQNAKQQQNPFAEMMGGMPNEGMPQENLQEDIQNDVQGANF